MSKVAREGSINAAITRPPAEYILGSTLAEHERLNRQGRLIFKLTRHFLDEIGLSPGMRVLDVGSGVGDLSLFAARAVGASGQVVCLDTDTQALSVAKDRAIREGLNNVLFHRCDLYRYATTTAFDAIIGRCVLLHQNKPLDALTKLLRHLRAGGIVAFQEPWFSRAFSYPEAPLFQRVLGWLHDTVKERGLEGDIGVRLPSLYESAGLARPQLSFEMLVDCSAESEIYDFCVDTVRSLLPHIQDLGISTAEEVDVDTLAQRLRSEADELSTVIGVMPLMGAWSMKL